MSAETLDTSSWNEDKDGFLRQPPVTGKLIEMGDLKTADFDGTLHEQKMAILVRFDSVEDIRRAINEGVCRFVWPRP